MVLKPDMWEKIKPEWAEAVEKMWEVPFPRKSADESWDGKTPHYTAESKNGSSR